MTKRLLPAILLLLGLLLGLLPAAASAQTPEATVQRAIARAAEAGIPVDLLQSKVAEGRAKGVPMDRIAGAVERRLAVLQLVRTTIDTDRAFTSEELGVAGDALSAGVDEDVLRTISATAPREGRAVAIAALSQLVRLGHPSEEALRRVTEALNSGPEALMNLPGQAAAAAARRGPPAGAGPPGAGPGGQGRGGPPPGVPGKGKPPVKPGNSGNGS
jgi:hypothetical protein